MLIPVPIYCEALAEGTAFNIDFRVYINLPIPRATIAYDLSQFTMEVDNCVSEDGSKGPWKFTIFFSHHVRP